MIYRVRLSVQVKAALKHLATADKGMCQYLVLLLLRLKKTPEQPESRELDPLGTPVPGSRVWKPDRFEILYQIRENTGEVIVAVVKVDGLEPITIKD